MNTCSQCGFANRVGARFCAKCGASLGASQVGGNAPARPSAQITGGYTLKVCPRCQTHSRVGEARCGNCGYTFAKPVTTKYPWRTRLIIAAGVVALGLLFWGGRAMLSNGAPTNPADGDQPAMNDQAQTLQRAIRATVQVIAEDAVSPTGYSAGSGTVVDAAKGIILTNFHVIGDPQSGQMTDSNGGIQIAVTPAGSNQSPETLYQARVLEGDRQLDLAVLQITARRNGSNLPDNLGLTAIPLGNSAGVSIGDEVTVLGYPGLGGDTITLTRGSVSGFVDGWIKTDAEINHGNSGGAAINAAGELIGVPSAGVSEEASDERLPGKIGLVRPINMASRMLARAGVQ